MDASKFVSHMVAIHLKDIGASPRTHVKNPGYSADDRYFEIEWESYHARFSTWYFFVQLFAEDYDFDSFCGTEIGVYGEQLTGEVTRRFNGYAKEMGGEFADSIAKRDSGSDHQVFALTGTSITLNAKESTRRLASMAIDIDDLMKLLPLMGLR